MDISSELYAIVFWEFAIDSLIGILSFALSLKCSNEKTRRNPVFSLFFFSVTLVEVSS